jgi:hypothetical protein
MKILLQSMATSLFLAFSNDWTPDVEDAMEFQRGSAAIDYSTRHGMNHTAVVYRFEDSVYDFRIPLDKSSERRHPN